jgi:hypothetical protein
MKTCESLRVASPAGVEVLDAFKVSAVCPRRTPVQRYVSPGCVDTLGYKTDMAFDPAQAE